ncbi:MAG TPA: MarR family transcriptional regulator, partial [Blastocatellia bacterium]|nr:MarR family transcriptional regulator [Blastocatellia bacterium]
AMLNLLIAAAHIRERLDRVCSEFGVTQGQYNVLRILKGVYPEGHPRCEIARRMLERAPDVTRLIDRLGQQKYVERDRSEDDRRLSVTRITKKGLDLLERMDKGMREVHDYFADRVSLADRRELSRICEGLYSD